MSNKEFKATIVSQTELKLNFEQFEEAMSNLLKHMTNGIMKRLKRQIVPNDTKDKIAQELQKN